ncbi:sterile alpha motif domain-containing protein 15 isoform X1 [Corvus moneduloides]|uniref:sterile alpha motif domain-containing protein 15 isoform X1 n=1 Tax=Corvus moneduloides TaxID=1196302 RepID=UPI0013628FC3|nr:sterile alpha motif domain-containing protein 15 isoform X1 [Corvus moneduloides]
MEPMEPRPGPAGPGVAEGPHPEPEGVGGPGPVCPFLSWSADEVAEWVVQLGFPQYEVRGCRPGRETPALGTAWTGGPELSVCMSVCVCERRGAGSGRVRPAFPSASLPRNASGPTASPAAASSSPTAPTSPPWASPTSGTCRKFHDTCESCWGLRSLSSADPSHSHTETIWVSS